MTAPKPDNGHCPVCGRIGRRYVTAEQLDVQREEARKALISMDRRHRLYRFLSRFGLGWLV